MKLLSKLSRVCLFMGLLVMSALAVERSKLPTNESELRVFFEGLALKKIDITKFSGTYALPKELPVFGKGSIKYMEFNNGRMTLKREMKDDDGFVFVYQPSIDKLLSASTVGELMQLIKLPEGGDYWKVFSPNSLLSSKDQKSSFACEIPIRACFFSNASMFFYSALIPAKQTEDEVANIEKPLGSWGPILIKLQASQVTKPPTIDLD